jgi:hypothetical protein
VKSEKLLLVKQFCRSEMKGRRVSNTFDRLTVVAAAAEK